MSSAKSEDREEVWKAEETRYEIDVPEMERAWGWECLMTAAQHWEASWVSHYQSVWVLQPLQLCGGTGYAETGFNCFYIVLPG